MSRPCLLLVAVAACGHAATPMRHTETRAATPRAVQAPAAPLSPDHVLAAVTTRYLPGLRRCYQQQIKRDARVRGKLTLSFTIDERGRVTEATARGLAPKLGECIERRMLAWTFAAPPAEASFRIPVRLDAL